MKKRIILIILLMLSGFSLFSDDAGVFFETTSASYSLTPGIEYPVEFGQTLLTLGGQAVLSARLPLAFMPSLSLTPAAGYSFIPIRAENSLSIIKPAVGIGYRIEPDPRICIDASLRGGIYIGIINEQAVDGEGLPYDTQLGLGPLLEAESEVSLFLSPSFSLGLRLGYSGSFGLYHSLTAGIVTRLNVEGLRKQVIMTNIEIDPLFPGISRYYDLNQAGSFSIENSERFPLDNLRVELFIEDYMDESQLCLDTGSLPPGKSLSGPLRLLFNEEVLDLTGEKLVPVYITASYSLNGEKRQTIVSGETVIYNRNALTWDDDRKAAAFVSSKSPEILEYAGNAALAAAGMEIISPSRNMSIALALYDSLKLYGLSYVVDPETLSYEEAREQSEKIDFIQFPLQTLLYRGGDCDDLSVLFCSLLEAAGVETAFLTVPGHIMPAFAIEAPASEALKIFSRKNDLIIDGEKAWIPIEITMLNDNFFRAWGDAASNWNENKAADSGRIYPVRDAWKVYPPSGGPGGIEINSPPSQERLREIYYRDLSLFVDAEIAQREAVLKRQIAASNAPAKAVNTLGALYARYGLYEKAEEQFRAAMEMDYLPAIINMGNLHFMKSDYERALTFYKLAEKSKPDKPSILLALSRTTRVLGQLASSKSYYSALKTLSPSLAARYSYLDTPTAVTERAASATPSEVIWEDD